MSNTRKLKSKKRTERKQETRANSKRQSDRVNNGYVKTNSSRSRSADNEFSGSKIKASHQHYRLNLGDIPFVVGKVGLNFQIRELPNDHFILIQFLSLQHQVITWDLIFKM